MKSQMYCLSMALKFNWYWLISCGDIIIYTYFFITVVAYYFLSLSRPMYIRAYFPTVFCFVPTCPADTGGGCQTSSSDSGPLFGP